MVEDYVDQSEVDEPVGNFVVAEKSVSPPKGRSEASHTPGPWRYNEEEHAIYAQAHVRVTLFSPDSTALKDLGNPTLIAAAPELLEALQAATSSIYADAAMGRIKLPTGFEHMEAAIAKAEGRA